MGTPETDPLAVKLLDNLLYIVRILNVIRNPDEKSEFWMGDKYNELPVIQMILQLAGYLIP